MCSIEALRGVYSMYLGSRGLLGVSLDLSKSCVRVVFTEMGEVLSSRAKGFSLTGLAWGFLLYVPLLPGLYDLSPLLFQLL